MLNMQIHINTKKKPYRKDTNPHLITHGQVTHTHAYTHTHTHTNVYIYIYIYIYINLNKIRMEA